MNVLSLFDGMSCGQIACERAGIKVDHYWASEIDKYAIEVTQNNYPYTKQLGDVKNIVWGPRESLNSDTVLYPKVDLLLAGSPCQGFSFSGQHLAFEDPRSKLYFEFERILNETNPKWWLLENVKMTAEHRKIISQRLNREPVEINSALVSGQNRKRYYWTNIPFEMPKDRGITWRKACNINDSYTIVGKGRGRRKQGPVKNQNKAPCLTSSSWQCNNWMEGYSFRCKQIPGWNPPNIKFTPEHFEALQTVPGGYTSCVSDSQRYKMLGNGWTVDVIAHILRGIKNDN